MRIPDWIWSRGSSPSPPQNLCAHQLRFWRISKLGLSRTVSSLFCNIPRRTFPGVGVRIFRAVHQWHSERVTVARGQAKSFMNEKLYGKFVWASGAKNRGGTGSGAWSHRDRADSATALWIYGSVVRADPTRTNHYWTYTRKVLHIHNILRGNSNLEYSDDLRISAVTGGKRSSQPLILAARV